ncbi:cytochrome P450 [Lanmaoa asiatica]|nr:cytochrome P450 [Lanmaoa asiatica]
MTFNPHVSRKAQEDLDSEVGDRPPTFGDRDRLPYLRRGDCEEGFTDFTYQGYTIPKGAMVPNNPWLAFYSSSGLKFLVAVRQVTHDPALFDDPDAFIPERFLESEDSKQRQPNVRSDDLAFGYGRRVCVSRHVAVNTPFITIAMLLLAFEFYKVLDDHRNEITPPAMEFFNTGGTVRSNIFLLRLILRNACVLECFHD